ncbi:hypothetical protein B0T14DRAFT_173065 [Immersiella caudata]|uniref:Uncharacterized protein n=1 Tax=Immersiella caudata TaxID=314043 RepID=A0AA39WXB0_9PEZI|nr:hypothetical protein B0T14DRAFT_173065 [Immersiella caudata]
MAVPTAQLKFVLIQQLFPPLWDVELLVYPRPPHNVITCPSHMPIKKSAWFLASKGPTPPYAHKSNASADANIIIKRQGQLRVGYHPHQLPDPDFFASDLAAGLGQLPPAGAAGSSPQFSFATTALLEVSLLSSPLLPPSKEFDRIDPIVKSRLRPLGLFFTVISSGCFVDCTDDCTDDVLGAVFLEDFALEGRSGEFLRSLVGASLKFQDPGIELTLLLCSSSVAGFPLPLSFFF